MESILFLGTGAADWNPAEATADAQFRRLTAALVSDTMLIDCGPCVFEFEKTFGYEKLYANVTDILITHSHGDHFHAGNIARVAKEARNPVRIYGDAEIAARIPVCGNLTFVPVRCFEPFTAGNHTVIAVPANHSTDLPKEQPLHYIVTDAAGEKTFFWGCDGGWLLNRTYHELIRHKFDMMVFDCTVGDLHCDFRCFEHNDIEMLEIITGSLCNNHHVLKENGRIFANHIARTLRTEPEILNRLLTPLGITPTQDNLKITF